MNKILKQIITFNTARNWKQFHSPKNLAISLVLEANEVLEIFQWTKDNKLPSKSKLQLAKEMADTYYWLLLLAYYTKIDLNKALEQKMKENEAKYPVEKSKGKSTKYNKL